MERRHLLVSGKVQGVFFRKFTQREGTSLGLTGWVQNLKDGRVEVIAEGPAEAVSALEQWCQTKGSPSSRVDGVEVEVSKATGEFSAFDIRR